MNTFRHGVALAQEPRAVFDRHLRPASIERLVPPWSGIEIGSRTGAAAEGGRQELGLPWLLRRRSITRAPRLGC